ncbi:MAG: hypothetical protein KBB52_03900 [Candidatus Omnitrophica bacterium]|nr:hypothetical protein [Candidatus Omnitrophota bacterium]
MTKPGFSKITLIILASIAILAALIYANAEKIAIFFISKNTDTKISYESLKNNGFRTFDFIGLALNDKRTGAGFLATTANVTPYWDEITSGKITLDFKLKDVRFTKWAPDEKDDYSTLPGLIAVPFSSKWKYQEITGAITVTKAGVRLNNLVATSDLIKLSVSGIVQKTGDMDADVTVYFSNALFSKIPENFTKMVFKKDGEDWQSISVKLTGNYQIPSIEISSKTFRLNIGLLKEFK